MHFSTEQAGEVKAWMVKKLEDISDADPDILADYSCAIFESSASDQDIRKSAIENLEDFLKEHTVQFVDEIFARYAPKPLPLTTASTQSAVTNLGQQPKAGLPIQSYESAPVGSQTASDKLNTGRKRSYHDANGHGQDIQYGNGVASKSSRSRRGPKDARPSGRGVSLQQPPLPAAIPSYPFGNMPLPPTPPPGFPTFDPTNPMAAFAFMQTMYPQMAGGLPPSPNGGERAFGDKPRCQNYDSKGYCTLGSSCPFEHGNDIIVAPRNDEYDPTKANFSMNGTRRGAINGGGRTQRTRRAHGNGSMGHLDSNRNNKASFSDTRLPADQNCTTVVVEQIPEEYFEDEMVRKFFSQYGKVLEVSMKAYKRLALVKYDTHAAAKRAWESPKAVFENRFVKVYWYRPDLESTNSGTRNASSLNDTNATNKLDEAGEEAFNQQQDEKQKAHEERKRIKKAMEDTRQDLARRRERMAKDREALVTKLAVAEGHDIGQLKTDETEKLQDGVGTGSPDPKIKALRDQLAKMQAEAKSLGIDPDAAREDNFYASRGRGRGSRGSVRGGFAARAAYHGYGSPRGNYRGHGFVRGRDPSVKKLDNRPRSIAISGVAFDNAKEENLRSYLTLTGPFEDIELNPQRTDSRIIVFKERWMAEQIMHGKSDIPGLGKVELSWVASIASGAAGQETSNDGDVVLGGADDGRGGTFGDEAHRPRDENLDVAGEDDDDWGNIT